MKIAEVHNLTLSWFVDLATRVTRVIFNQCGERIKMQLNDAPFMNFLRSFKLYVKLVS